MSAEQTTRGRAFELGLSGKNFKRTCHTLTSFPHRYSLHAFVDKKIGCEESETHTMSLHVVPITPSSRRSSSNAAEEIRPR